MLIGIYTLYFYAEYVCTMTHTWDSDTMSIKRAITPTWLDDL